MKCLVAQKQNSTQKQKNHNKYYFLLAICAKSKKQKTI